MIRKILLSLNALILAILLTITPVNRAQAALPLVLPIGWTAATGVYVVGALGIAALAGAVGIEYGDEINAHAHSVWGKSTQLAKDGINATLNSAVGAGNATIDLSADFINWFDEQLALYSSNLAMLNQSPTISNQPILDKFYTTSGSYRVTTNLSQQSLNLLTVYQDGTHHLNTNSTSQILVNIHSSYLQIGAEIAFYWSQMPSGYRDQVISMYEAAGTAQAVIALSNSFAKTFQWQVVDQTYNHEIYNNLLTKLREKWTEVRDAGLVLPVDSATPYAGDVLINYDRTTDVYTGIDGQVYNPSDVTWQFPQTKWRTGTADIPEGVYVDTPVLTGNPAIDQPLINNPAIPKTTTNVTTGVTYANPDIATDTPIETPVETPILNPPKNPSKTISMVPLIIAGETLTTKFPFSLPWDMIRQLSVFDVEPEAPVFEVDVQNYLTFPELGISIPFKMDIDLTFLDPVAAIARWGTIIAFDIALILMLRRLLPE